MSSQVVYPPGSPSRKRAWNELNYYSEVIKEVQEVMLIAWGFMIGYKYVNTEILSIMECTERLVHLFLSDPDNKNIHSRYDEEEHRGILAIKSLKISWSL